MLEDRLSAHKARMKGYTELRVQENTSKSVVFIGGNMVRNQSAVSCGVSARVYRNGVYGFASAAETDDDSIARVLAAASDNAAFFDGRLRKGKPPLPATGHMPMTMPRPAHDIAANVRIDFARQLDEYIGRKYPQLASHSIMVSDLDMEKLMVTSDGADVHSYVPRSYVYVDMTANTDDGTPVTLFEPFGGYGFFDEVHPNIEGLFEGVETLYRQVMDKRQGVFSNAGVKTCILHADLAGMLAHEAVGHTVEADIVLGGSVAANLMDQQVASELVTMVDFAHTALGQPCPVPVVVDDEGVIAQDAVLIEKGMLRSYMHNRETAQHFGVEPTGNARAYKFSDEPLVRMRNTAVLPGTSKLDDLIASVDDGYYLIKTGNGQADTTGEFMFSVDLAYEIKNGKLGKAVRETTVSGVAFEMLKTVDMVSDDMSWTCSGMCGKKQMIPVGMGGPALRCKISIGGV